MRRIRVVLDANVLVDAQVRDIFLRLADQELIDYFWSDGLLDELRMVLTSRQGRPPAKVDRLCNVIRQAFPEGATTSDVETISDVDMPDPGDAHVLAAAVACEADILITHDRGGFPPDETLDQWGLEVLAPDYALVEMIQQFGIDTVSAIFKAATEGLTNPPVELSSQLKRLERTAPLTAVALGNSLGVPDYQRLAHAVITAGNPDNPRTTVHRLMDHLEAEDVAAADALLSTSFKQALGPHPKARYRMIRKQLDDILQARDTWGFTTSDRPIAPDTEIVLLVQGDMPRIYAEPTLVTARAFRLVRQDDNWLIDALNPPEALTSRHDE